MAPRWIALGSSSRAAHCHVDLVVDRSRTLEELPVDGTRRRVECAGVDHGDRSLPRCYHGRLWETDVVAYALQV